MILMIFDEIGWGEGDFFCNLFIIIYDELCILVEFYNCFVDKMWEIISEVCKMMVNIVWEVVIVIKIVVVLVECVDW